MIEHENTLLDHRMAWVGALQGASLSKHWSNMEYL